LISSFGRIVFRISLNICFDVTLRSDPTHSPLHQNDDDDAHGGGDGAVSYLAKRHEQ